LPPHFCPRRLGIRLTTIEKVQFSGGMIVEMGWHTILSAFNIFIDFMGRETAII